MKEELKIEEEIEIDEMSLYNFAVSNSCIIIDMRGINKAIKEEKERLYLRNSKMILRAEDEEIEQLSLEELLKKDLLRNKEEEENSFLQRSKQKLLNNNQIILITSDNEERMKRKMLAEKISKLSEQFKKKYMYIKNYDKFTENYHFICTNNPTELSISRMLQYPNQIDENLYLGNAPNAFSEDCITHLKIKSIVNVTLDAPNKFEDQGVMYLQIKVEDFETEDLSKSFKNATSFIHSSIEKKQNGFFFFIILIFKIYFTFFLLFFFFKLNSFGSLVKKILKKK